VCARVCVWDGGGRVGDLREYMY